MGFGKATKQVKMVGKVGRQGTEELNLRNPIIIGPDDSSSNSSLEAEVEPWWKRMTADFKRGADEYSFRVLGLGDQQGRPILLSPLPAAIVILQALEVLVAMAFLGFPDSRRDDDSALLSNENAQTTIDVQLGLLAVVVVQSWMTLLMTLAAYLRDNLSKMQNIATIKVVILGLCDIPLVGYPTDARLAFITFLFVFHSLEIILLLVLDVIVKSTEPGKKITDVPVILRSIIKMRGHVGGRHAISTPITANLIERLLAWLSPKDSASATMGFSSAGRQQVLHIALVLLAFAAANFAFDFTTSVTVDVPLLDKSDLAWVSQNINNTRWPLYSPTNNTRPQLQGGSAVVLMVFDGLNYKHMFLNPRMQATINNHYPDLLVRKLFAELPSTNMPNWFGILGGVRPEVSGQRGDVGIGSGNNLDTVVHRAKESGLRVGSAAATWLQGLFRDNLDVLSGDGSIRSEFAVNQMLSDLAPDSDAARQHALLTALQYDTHDLLIGHYVNPTRVGNQHGSDHPQYHQAVTTAAEYIDQVLSRVSDDVTVVVTSSHGVTAAGGYGGESSLAVEVPLVVYKKNSNIRTTHTDPVFDTQQTTLSLTAVAPSLCALLGVPVPDHNMAPFLDEILELVDDGRKAVLFSNLFEQQRSFVTRFLSLIGDGDVVEREPALSTIDYVEETEGKTFPEATREVIRIYEEYRIRFRRFITWRNEASSFVVLATVLLLVLYTLQSGTLADPLSIGLFRMFPFLSLWWDCPDMVAVRYGILHSILYNSISWSLFGFVLIGYDGEFGFSFINSPTRISLYLALVFCPGLFVSVVVNRFLSLWHCVPFELRDDSAGKFAKVSWYLYQWSFGRIVFANTGLIYLIRLYALVSAMVTTAGLLLLGSAYYSFMIPLVFRLPFVDDGVWYRRFQILTALGISLPMLAHTMFLVWSWRLEPIDSTVLNDLNSLRLGKARRYKRHLTVNIDELENDAIELQQVQKTVSKPNGRLMALDDNTRLSDWCVDVSSSTKLQDSEKRRLLNARMQTLKDQVRASEQEKKILMQQKEAMERAYDDRLQTLEDAVDAIRDNKEGIKKITADVKQEVKRSSTTKGSKKGKEKEAFEAEMQEKLALRIQEKENERKALVKQKLLNRMAREKAKEAKELVESMKEEHLKQLEVTMSLYKESDAAQADHDSAREELEDILARIKELETIKGRHAETVVGDTSAHKEINREIRDEIEKEEAFHYDITDAIDRTLEQIEAKQSALTHRMASHEQRVKEQKGLITKHRTGNGTGNRQMKQMFKEIASIKEKMGRVREDYAEALEWVTRYRRMLEKIENELE